MLTVKDMVYFLKTCLCTTVSYGAGNPSFSLTLMVAEEEKCLLASHLEDNVVMKCKCNLTTKPQK